LSASSRTDQEKRLAARDAAELLYRHGVGGVIVTAVASTAIFAMLHGSIGQTALLAWLGLMLLTTAARALDLLRGHRRRMNSGWDGQAEMRRFAIPVLASAALWACLPLAFFHEMSPVDRTAMAMILSAMAAGGATVFAAARRLCLLYCSTLVLPMSAMFLLTPSRENRSDRHGNSSAGPRPRHRDRGRRC
jgi:hypothetical protein